MNLQELQGLSPEEIKNVAAYMMLQSYAIIFINLTVMFITYLIRAYALSKICRKLGFERTKTAWIPFGNGYVEGYICDYLKSPRLDKSNMRTHYLMINIIHFTLNTGYMLYQAVWTTNILMPVFQSGELSLNSLQPEMSNAAVFLSVANTVFLLIVSYFRFKALLCTFICFGKKDGMILIGLSLIINFINPILYLVISSREPVHTSINQINEKKDG